ncbi:hypothetical protein DFO50_11167 [Microvirgula sp. AG722]|uniref:hypothetical protein n=1 Tax=Microvirgula sp. AG722 TaxID=2183901 RepID=UPI000DC3F2F6|nr:hypothetical protein [Microvirgula sp. AG722]RAS14252.1 hypothetical protein DFO50_11167 [Microvirgula sp. AG722]
MTEHQQELKKLAKQQEYALQLEKVKWVQRKQELAFLEAGQHMRALNQLMWQVPNIAMAITGGLWYGAANLHAQEPRVWVFAFAALADCMTVITLWRLRHLIQKEIDKQSRFTAERAISDRDEGKKCWIKRAYTAVFSFTPLVVRCWTIVLLAAAVVSIFGACNAEKFSTTPAPLPTSAPSKPSQGKSPVSQAVIKTTASSSVSKKSP